MHSKTLGLVVALGLGVGLASANAAPMAPAPLSPEASNIVQIAGGCSHGVHRDYRGYCMPTYYPHSNYREYFRTLASSYQYMYPYYGGDYEAYLRYYWRY
jgi:hypothetical protein